MNIKPLYRVIIDYALFLEMSSDKVIQPDMAHSQLGRMASTLQELGETDRKEFLKYIHNLAESEELLRGKTKRVEFLLSLGKNLGLC